MTLIEVNEACSSLDVLLGSFVTLLEEILVGRQPLGRPEAAQFSLFVEKDSHCGSPESRSHRNVFATPPRLMDLNGSFTPVLLQVAASCAASLRPFSRLHLAGQVLLNRCVDGTGLTVLMSGRGW